MNAEARAGIGTLFRGGLGKVVQLYGDTVRDVARKFRQDVT